MTTSDRPTSSDGTLDRAREIEEWYTKRARDFVAEHEPALVPTFDRDAADVRHHVEQYARKTEVCFLGHAGVGKSTLLNALAAGAEMLLPTTGVGPLTAQETRVRWAPQGELIVEYHPPNRFQRVLNGLDLHYRAELRRSGSVTPAEEELHRNEPDSDLDSKEALSSLVPEYRKQAQLMLLGSQTAEAELPYLIDGLCLAMGRKVQYGTVPSVADSERLERLRACLALGKEQRQWRLGSDDAVLLKRELQNHSAGFLAPLIKRLEVGWPSELLRDGLVLVDLPGLGIDGDLHAQVTDLQVRGDAQAIVLVIDRAGVTKESADLLARSRFIERLMYSVDDAPSDPMMLMVAVVKLDLGADAAALSDESRGWEDHFREICDKMIPTVQGQIRQRLEEMVASGSVQLRADRQTVVDRIMDRLEVHPVAGLEYTKFLKGNPKFPPKVEDPRQTRLPAFAAALARVAEHRRREMEDMLRDRADTFRSRVARTIELTRSKWREDTRAVAEAERLRHELEEFLRPLRRELDSRRAAFREHLTEALPQQIRLLLDNAALVAKEEISTYLDELGAAHWATLRATVRRKGTFDGARYINLPEEFATKFATPVATVWAKDILADLRKRPSELVEHYVRIVDTVLTWSEQRSDARLKPDAAVALREKISADAKYLAAVCKENIQEMRERVRAELAPEIAEPIRERCQEFVRAQRDVSPGVKQRILKLFEELVPEVVKVAKPRAQKVLLDNYQSVREEIVAVLEQYPDPLSQVADTIVTSREAFIKRSDAQKRKRVLERADAILGALIVQQETAQ